MPDSGLVAVAKVVFSNREHLVLVRPVGEKLLGMTVLEHAAQVKQPATFADEVAAAEIGRDEATLARELLDGMTDAEPDLSKYRNWYAENLKALIESRVKNEELVAPPAGPTPQVINLMDALIASLEQVKKPSGKPLRKMEMSVRRKQERRKKRTA